MHIKKYLSLTACVLILGFNGGFNGTASGSAGGHKVSEGVPPDQALQRLVDGNARFASWKATHPNQDIRRLTEVHRGQKPFATILTCADSRVPPEVLFDQGLGDLFVVRIAGNIVTPEILGSLEYAVDHLGTKLIYVLGHESCGAVDATLAGKTLPGHIETIAREIRPALKDLTCATNDQLDCGVKANVKHVAQEIESSRPILSELIKSHALEVVGGYYSLKTGQVSIQEDSFGP